MSIPDVIVVTNMNKIVNVPNDILVDVQML